ncbi:hypothetical protein [uncultured Nostoc sp.]|uniref:hypothetical protein n=1 Tax=uncultured Nostoc sp. TaxID=340711 RepID=UPI0035CA0A08
MKLLKLVSMFLLTGAFVSAQTIISITFSHPAVSQSTNRSKTIEVPFKICSSSETWVRPTKAEQMKFLLSTKRYDDLTKEPEYYERWLRYNIFSFTTFGGSSFFDYHYLAGLWTPTGNPVWQCDKKFSRTKINTGEIAEVWVLLYRVISIKWVGNHYLMVVKPTKKGFQKIQLSRREDQDSLPLKVITEDGSEMKVLPFSPSRPY